MTFPLEVDDANTMERARLARLNAAAGEPTEAPPSVTVSHHPTGGAGSAIEYIVSLESLSYDPPIRVTGKAYNEALALENAQAAYATAKDVRDRSRR